jgi:hypothetical protein
MEARWISALVGGRAPPSVLRASFLVFRVKVCRGSAQVVVAMPRAIRSPRLQPHLGGNIERFVGVVWSSRILSGCGDLRIIKEFHRQFFLLLRLRDGCGFLTRSATSRPQQRQADSGRNGSGRRRRHGLEVEDERLFKDLIVIFVFRGVLCTVHCFF